MDGKVGIKSQEDAKSSPNLSAHNQASPNQRRAILSCVNGYRGCFAAHPKAHKDTCDEDLVSVLNKTRANDGKQAEDARYENCTASAKYIVERVGHPTTNHRSGQVGSGVDGSHNPGVDTCLPADVKGLCNGQTSTIRAVLIPSSGNLISMRRAKFMHETYCTALQRRWDTGWLSSRASEVPPLVGNFVPDRFGLETTKVLDRFKSSRISGHKSNLPQELSNVL